MKTIFDGIYNILSETIFGVVATGTYQELVCTQLSTILSVAYVALPFVVVFWVIRSLFR